MHYRRYIVRDGVPIMPDTTNDAEVIMTVTLNGTRIDITKDTYDILDFGYIIESDNVIASLNRIIIKSFVRVRDKSTNKIYEGTSTGFAIGYGSVTLWPDISEV